jgi:ribosome-binding ATPase
MKLGLLGLPKSGKTTLFNALTNSAIDVNAYSAKAEPNIAIAKVTDERVGKLSEMYKPKNTVYATIEFVDVVGVEEGAAKNEKAFSDLVQVIRNADAIAIVIRNFESGLAGKPAPLDDVRKIDEEFLLADLIIAENRLQKLEAGFKKGIKTPQLVAEDKALKRIQEQINASKPIREMAFSAEEELAIKGYQFLSKKPAIVILNSNENSYGKNQPVLDEIAKSHRVIEFAGAFEMELSRLEPADAAAFMEEMGIKESAKNRLTILAYDTLGYISFFTVGEDEVRAWTLKKGLPALDAAGTIHSDLARVFIAAECFTYQDLIDLGSEKAIKEKGKFKLEGKTYEVKDGDILNIRFNV